MRSYAIKRKLVYNLTVANTFGLKQLSTNVKSFIAKALGYKAILKFTKQFVCVLVMSPCSYDLLLMPLYI